MDIRIVVEGQVISYPLAQIASQCAFPILIAQDPAKRVLFQARSSTSPLRACAVLSILQLVFKVGHPKAQKCIDPSKVHSPLSSYCFFVKPNHNRILNFIRSCHSDAPFQVVGFKFSSVLFF